MRSRLAIELVALIAVTPVAAVAQPAPPPIADPPAPSAPAPSPPPQASPAAPSPTAAGQAPEEVILVTGLRLPRPLHDVPAAATVIDREQLERSPHVLADDLVRAVPDVGTFRRSSSSIADPTSQGLNLRGVGPSGVSRALVLRDGLPVNDPFGGWVYWRAMSPLGIDRIEIVPSGASALFGNFALGGVLQVISRPNDGRSIDAVAAGGSLGTGRFAVRATERIDKLGIAVDAEGLHSEGYTPIVADQRGVVDGDASSTHGAGGLRLDYDLGDSKLHAGLRVFDESLDAGTQHTTADVRTIGYEAGWEIARDPGRLSVQAFGGNQRFEQERARVTADRATATSASKQRTPSNNQGVVATWTARAIGMHSIVVGIDGQRVAGTSTDSLTPPMVQPDTLVKRAAGGEQRFLGAFAQDALQITPELQVAAAARIDGWQNVSARRTLTLGDGSATTTPLASTSEVQLDPRLGALYHITPEVAVRASGYRAFRAPTLNELYRPFQVGTVLTGANDRLKPETLWGSEVGGQLVLEQLTAQVTGFWNRLSDPIANVTLAAPMDGATRQRQNLGSARILGVDVDVAWRPAAAWTVRVGHMFSDAKVTEAPAQPDLVGKRLAQDPRNRTTAAVTFDESRIATITGEVRYLGRQYEDDQNTLGIGAVVLFDARVERDLVAGLSVFASGQNLFDRRYIVGRAGVDTEGAPRTFELGLAYHARSRR
jgi:iron complex outermembrane receptor protein